MRNQIEAADRRWACGPAPSTAPTPTSGPRSSPTSMPTRSTCCSSRPSAWPTAASATPCSTASGRPRAWSSSTRRTASATGATTSGPTTGGSAASSTLLPPDVPVLACTATANDRVVDDIVAQLGDDLDVARGPLARDSLALHVIDLPTPAAAHGVAGRGHPRPARHRHRLLPHQARRRAGRRVAGGQRHRRRLLHRRLRAAARTSSGACSPTRSRSSSPPRRWAWASTSPTWPSSSTSSRRARPSPTTSRSGGPAASSTARSACCCAAARTATSRTGSSARPSPPARRPRTSSPLLEARDDFTKLGELERAVNVRPSRLELLLKVLEVDGADRGRRPEVPAHRRGRGPTTPSGSTASPPCAAPSSSRCTTTAPTPPTAAWRSCSGCSTTPTRRRAVGATAAPGPTLAPGRRSGAGRRGRRPSSGRQPFVIEPRKQLPNRSQARTGSAGSRSAGRWAGLGDGGWGTLVRDGRDEHRFADELVDALAAAGRRRGRPHPRRPGSPSSRRCATRRCSPTSPSAWARRSASRCTPSSSASPSAEPQSAMANSTRQLGNVVGAFAVRRRCRRARSCSSTTPSTPAGPSPRSAACSAMPVAPPSTPSPSPTAGHHEPVNDAAKAVLALTNSLVDAGARPLKAAEVWPLLEAVGDPSTLLGPQRHRPGHGAARRRRRRTGGHAARLGPGPGRPARARSTTAASGPSPPFDPDFPAALFDRLGHGTPPVLYGAGEPALLAADAVGVVGSRPPAPPASRWPERWPSPRWSTTSR